MRWTNQMAEEDKLISDSLRGLLPPDIEAPLVVTMREAEAKTTCAFASTLDFACLSPAELA
jgi:hypothetical protein